MGDLAEVWVAQEGVPKEKIFRQEQKDGRKQAGGGHLPLHALQKNPFCSPCFLPQSRRPFALSTTTGQDLEVAIHLVRAPRILPSTTGWYRR